MSVRVCAILMATGVSVVSAAPTSFSVGMTGEIWDSDYITVDEMDLLEPGSATLGQTTAFNPLDSGFASVVNVSYGVETVGLNRTVTITYEADGGPLVFPALFEAMAPLPDDGLYGIFFRVFFSDAEWNGDNTTRSATPSLYGDGMTIVAGMPFFSSSSNLSPGSHGFVDFASPAESGFFGSPAIADTFEYVVNYQIVPAPGAAAMLGLCGLTAARRRR